MHPSVLLHLSLLSHLLDLMDPKVQSRLLVRMPRLHRSHQMDPKVQKVRMDLSHQFRRLLPWGQSVQSHRLDPMDLMVRLRLSVP